MATIPAFKVRGIETHSRQMWEWEHVRRLLEFARDNKMNTLVFHQNDLVDQLVNHEAFLPRDRMNGSIPFTCMPLRITGRISGGWRLAPRI